MRWGDTVTCFTHGETHFHSLDEVLAFSPLAKEDFTDWNVVMSLNYRDEETIYRHYPRRSRPFGYAG